MKQQYENQGKLNIAIVCDAVTDCVAGSFVSTLRFSERLEKLGHKIIFIAARSPKTPRDNHHGTIKAYRFPSFLLPKSEGQLHLGIVRRKTIKKILKDEKIDIVHTMIPTLAGIASIRAARELHIPIVNHSHTQPENLFMHMPPGPWINFLNRKFYQYMSWYYSQGDALIYPTQFSLDLLSNIRTDVKKYVISNGVESQRFAPVETGEFRERFSIPRNRTLILYAGRLHPEKSLDTLIAAIPLVMEEAPDAYFMLAGFGHLEDALKEQAERLGVKEHVNFLGRVSDEDMVAAQHASDIFVLPSLAELEGMVVLEAIASGKPIIIANSKESASTYFVEDNGFLFEPKNPQDLAGKIIHLVQNPKLRGEMGQKSLKISHNYDIDESVRRLEQLYYSLLQK